MDMANNWNAMSTAHHRSLARPGFTLIEILIVVGILVLLLSILVVKMRPALMVSKKQQTRVTMEALRTMTDELRQSTALAGFYSKSWPQQLDSDTAPSVSTDPSTWNTHPAVVRTRLLMARLLANQANRAIADRLPSGSLRVFPAAPGDPADLAATPVPVDAWGAPIIYVPPNGILLRTDAGLQRVTSARTQDIATAIPMGSQGFWMSAGEDNQYLTGADNVYSFDNN